MPRKRYTPGQIVRKLRGAVVERQGNLAPLKPHFATRKVLSRRAWPAGSWVGILPSISLGTP